MQPLILRNGDDPFIELSPITGNKLGADGIALLFPADGGTLYARVAIVNPAAEDCENVAILRVTVTPQGVSVALQSRDDNAALAGATAAWKILK